MTNQNNLTLKELTLENIEEIKTLFKSVFMKEPWNDDWSDDVQLTEYMKDLMITRLPINLGLFADDVLVGLSIGSIKHWCRETEYVIDEFCINTELQGQGLGTKFIKLIEEYLIKIDIHTIYLQTAKDAPAYQFYKKRGFSEIDGDTAFFKEIYFL